MSRILALDYGLKKVGIALSDETKSMALPFLVLENKGDKKLAEEICEICRKNSIEKVIIGLPKTLEGKEGKQAHIVYEFANILKQEITLPIIFEDERLTSKMAQQFLEKDNLSISLKTRKVEDKIAAQILLQGYLDRINQQSTNNK